MSLKSKINLLVNIFNQYIRLSNTDDHGYGKCISCGKIKGYPDLDAGHFVNCKHLSLKFSETNVNVQCISCNRFDEGNVSGYTLGLITKYGHGIIEKLHMAKYKNVKYTEFEINVMIDNYRRLSKKLASEKSFKINLK